MNSVAWIGGGLFVALGVGWFVAGLAVRYVARKGAALADRATLRSQRLPGGPCIKCKAAPAEEKSLWCQPCHDFIHGKGHACLRCHDLPQHEKRPWCVRCAHEIDEFDSNDPRGLDEK